MPNSGTTAKTWKKSWPCAMKKPVCWVSTITRNCRWRPKWPKSRMMSPHFLEDLADRSWRHARKDLAELREFAKQHYGINDLQSWDMAYYSEKMRQHFYQLSQEEVKTYFPITRVLPGLFAIVEKLYGLQISELTGFDSWHPDVRFFEIHDKHGQLRGQFYLDLYARAKKRGGAWMDDCVSRKRFDDTIQTPVAYLTCNFTPPTGDTPALLTHDEVTTLFHEFGHGLHHMLTQVDHLGVSGINGVEWDAVELPSQFMENWCWEQEAVALMSGHYQTDEKLPDALFEKMIAAKNFQAGMIMVGNWNSACSISGFTGTTTLKKAAASMKFWNKSGNKSPLFVHPNSTALRTASRIFLQAVMQPVTTAINGRKFYPATLFHCLKKKAFSTRKPAKPF